MPLTWTAAVALAVAAVTVVAILVSDRRETFRSEAYGAMRHATDVVLTPAGEALAAPVRWTGDGIEAIRGYFFAASENRRLKTELKEMRQWRDAALALRNENARFRTLLGLQTDPPVPMVAARVVTDSRGPFANTRIANVGAEKGVVSGNPVMSENGLVGRIIGVANGASRILLLTDTASKVPVMIHRTNARSILTGDGGANPRLEYLRGREPVREGDWVMTSGDGGVLPRGLPVGTAVKGLDGRWRVVLSADKAPIDFVRVLLFQDFTQLVNQKQLAERRVPPPTAGAETLLAPPEPKADSTPSATPAGAKPADGPAKTSAPTSGRADAKTAAPNTDPKPAPAKVEAASSVRKPSAARAEPPH